MTDLVLPDALESPASVRLVPLPGRGLVYVAPTSDDGTGATVRAVDLLRVVRAAAREATEEP